MRKITENKKKNEIGKKYVGALIEDVTREKWKKFACDNDFTTTSKMIRTAVNFYIELKTKITDLPDLSKLSHTIKEPLTSIKGFAQLLLENHKDELSWEVLSKIKQIFDNSKILEEKIKNALDKPPDDKEQCDILIVDDDDSTIVLLHSFFESRGFKCKDAYLGEEALELSQYFKPKLILLDILLPDKDGYEVCKTLKFDEEYKQLKNIPIYYITAVPEIDVSKMLIETGANGYFLKPFNLPEFNVLFDYL